MVRSSSGSSYFHFIWSIQGHLLPEESQEGILVVNFASRKLGFWSRIMASLMMRWRTFFYTTYYFYYLLDPTHLLFQLSPKASHQRRRSLLLLRFQSTLLSFSLVWLASSTSSPSTKDLKLNCRELGFWQRITRHFTTTASHITKKAVVWHWQKAATF